MLQDYLDGRLGDEARAEFEAMMESDPELAERVASYNEFGRALREDEPELSPGFYTRARARFEESRRGKMRMPRLLSWEAAGLATAAALVCVLFIPYLLDRDRKGEALPPTETIWEAPAVEEAVEEADDEPVLEEEKMMEPEFTPAPAAESLDDSMMLEGEKMERKAAVPPPPSVQADAVPAEPRREKGVKKRARGVVLGQMAETTKISPLPPGAVEPGSVSVEVMDPDRRRVLIGAREWPFRCEEIAVETTSQSYRITLRPATDPSLAAEWGCAVIVGNDHRTIEVLPPVDERR
jgi:hypothetical protein